MSVYEQLVEAEESLQRDSFASRTSYIQLYINTVDRDSQGNPLVARGTDPNGVPDFPVIVGGRAQVEEGETILAEFSKDAPAGGAIFYKAHLSSDLAGAGAVRLTPGPPPAYATPTWHTERIIGVPNAIYARITILFTIEPKYNPSKVIISHRQVGTTDWTDEIVPFLISSAIQGHELTVAYPSGVNVDVQMRAEYSYAYGPSDTSELRDVATPVDTASPGNASGLNVDVSIAGILHAEASGTIDRSRFIGWRYEFTQSPTGPPTATVVVDGPYDYHTPASGNWYVAVAPISVAGVLGSRYPSATTTVFSGPFVVTAPALPPDNTPPAAWGAPTLTARTAIRSDGGATGYLKVTFPAHSFESDYYTTVVKLTSGAITDEWVILYRGAAPDPVEKTVDYGTYTVWLYGTDNSGNKSALSSSANVTVSDPGIPATMGAPTVEYDPALGAPNSALPLSVAIDWTMPTNAETVQVFRYTAASGGVGVSIFQGLGTRFIDIHTELTSFPVNYWYTTRGRNRNGDGAESARVQGRINQVSGTVVAAGTLVGDRIIAGTLDGNTIKASTVISSLLYTAATGARWEIEGHTGSAGQDQIRMYSSTALKVSITSSALTYWGDGGQADIALGTASGRGYLATGGLTIGPYQTQIDLAFVAPTGFRNGFRFFDSGDVNTDFRFISSPAITGGTLELFLVSDSSASSPAGMFIGQAPSFAPGSGVYGVYFNRASLKFYAIGATPLSMQLVASGIGFGSSTLRYSGTVQVAGGNLSVHNNNNAGTLYYGNALTSYLTFNGTGFTLSNALTVVGGLTVSSGGCAFTGNQTNTGSVYSAVVYRAGVGSISTASYNGWNGDITQIASGSAGPTMWYNATTGTDGNRGDFEGFHFRFQGTNLYPGTSYMIRYMINGGSVLGGAAIFGVTTSAAYYWGLGSANGVMDMFWSAANNWIATTGNLHVGGTLSKVAGTFRIPHPDPAKSATLDLRHSFVESPTRGENIYRYTVQTDADKDTITIELPDWFAALNVLEGEGEDQYRPQVWTVGEGWDQDARGTVGKDGKHATIGTIGKGRYNVLIVATRKDKGARDHWDGEGGAEVPRALNDEVFNAIPLDKKGGLKQRRDDPALYRRKDNTPQEPKIAAGVGLPTRDLTTE